MLISFPSVTEDIYIKMDPLVEEEMSKATIVNPLTYVFQFLASYGWFLVGGAAIGLYVLQKMRPKLNAWKQAKEDAEYHKNPDVALASMESIQRAREKQQQALLAASERALELQKEREERKRQEAVERLRKYGSSAGNRLGDKEDGDYLPLSGGASTSSYRPPKRSKCGGGGCGK